MSDEKEFRDCNCTGKTTVTHYSYHECNNCNEPVGPVDAVPKDDLRELIEEWRDFEADIVTAQGLNMAADELEALLE